MEHTRHGRAGEANYSIPAIYTYFGQFIAHDISFLENIEEPIARLNLSSVYGLGPRKSAQLFYFSEHSDKSSINIPLVQLRLDKYKAKYLSGSRIKYKEVYDFYRINEKNKFIKNKNWKYNILNFFQIKTSPSRYGIPIIADSRNDENFILSQLHILFIRYHNFLASSLNSKFQREELFRETQKRVITIYHMVIILDYLEKILDSKVYEILISSGAINIHNFKLYAHNKRITLKQEFIKSAFRIGHSQVRSGYKINNHEGKKGEPGELLLFNKNKAEPDLRGFKRDSRRWINWELLHFKKGQGNLLLNPSNRINFKINSALTNLPYFKNSPKGNNNLIVRNLVSGGDITLDKFIQGWKKGQGKNITFPIKILNIASYSSDHAEEIKDFINDIGINHSEIKKLPLWLYILIEAQLQNEGKCLGELGSHIVAEQILLAINDFREKQEDKIHLKYTTSSIDINTLINLDIAFFIN